jgi:hypothetical protein
MTVGMVMTRPVLAMTKGSPAVLYTMAATAPAAVHYFCESERVCWCESERVCCSMCCMLVALFFVVKGPCGRYVMAQLVQVCASMLVYWWNSSMF